MVSEQSPLFDAFLSHSHEDAEAVEILSARLEDEARFRVWLDKWILVPGNHFIQDMARGLEDARTCIVCIGQSTPKGWFREEIEKALNRQTKNPSFRVIPVILPGGDSKIVDNFLELRTWVDFSKGFENPQAFHLLICGVQGVPPGRYRSTTIKASTNFKSLREMLLLVKELQLEQLIDDKVAIEYQWRLLDEAKRNLDKRNESSIEI